RTVRSGIGAHSWHDWQSAALALDAADGRNHWKENDNSPLYNSSLIRSLLNELRESRAAVEGIPFVPYTPSRSRSSHSLGSSSVHHSPALHSTPIPAFGLPDLSLCDPDNGYKTLKKSHTANSSSSSSRGARFGVTKDANNLAIA